MMSGNSSLVATGVKHSSTDNTPYDGDGFDSLAVFAVRSTTSSCMLSAPVIKHELDGISRMSLSQADVTRNIAKAKFRALIDILCGMRENDDPICEDCDEDDDAPFVKSPLGLRLLVMFLLSSNLAKMLLSEEEMASRYDRCDKVDFAGNHTRGGPDLQDAFGLSASQEDGFTSDGFNSGDDVATPLGPIKVASHSSVEDAAPAWAAPEQMTPLGPVNVFYHRSLEEVTSPKQTSLLPVEGEVTPEKHTKTHANTSHSGMQDAGKGRSRLEDGENRRSTAQLQQDDTKPPVVVENEFLRTVTFTPEQEEFITSVLEGLQQRLCSPPPAVPTSDKKKKATKEIEKKLALASDPTNTVGLKLPIEDPYKISDWDAVSRFSEDLSWDMEKTIDRVLMYMNWRQEHKVNELMKVGFTSRYNPGVGLPNLEETGALIREGFYGRDKLGRCVYYFKPDPKLMEKCLKNSKKDGLDATSANTEFILWHMAVCECSRYIQRLAKVDRSVAVVDLSNIGLGSLTYSQQLSIMREWNTVDMNFPGNLGQIYAINVPGSISSIWSVLGVILDKQTKEKVRFLKKKGELYNFIDRDQVPRSVMPDSDGPADFITVAEVISSFRTGNNGEADILLSANGGFL